MKKPVIVFFVLLFASSVFGAGNINAVVSSQQLTVGQTVDVNVVAANVNNLYGYQFDLNFKSSILSYNSITFTKLLGNLSSPSEQFCTDSSDWTFAPGHVGKVACTRTIAGEINPANGALATVKLNVIGQGVSDLNLYNGLVSNSNAQNVSVTVTLPSANVSSCGSPIACFNDAGCNDSNSLTTDICVNAGTCSAQCSNVVLDSCPSGPVSEPCLCGTQPVSSGFCCSGIVTNPCILNSDCPDSVTCTIDQCNAPSTCSASCSNAPINNCVEDSTHIFINGSGFSPSNASIAVGRTVTWINLDTVNQSSTSGTSPNPDGKWDSGIIAPNSAFSRIFNSTGTFQYFSSTNPSLTGLIVVSEPLPTCGNGSCDAGENQDNCSADCGSGGGGDGGGGGGGGSGDGSFCRKTLADQDGDCITRDKDCNDFRKDTGQCTGCLVCVQGACVEGAECQQVETGTGLLDSDGDGLTDEEEIRLGTNTNLIDSDFDLISDFQEVQDSTNPIDQTSNLVYLSFDRLLSVGDVQRILVLHPTLRELFGFAAEIIPPSGNILTVEVREGQPIEFIVEEPGNTVFRVYNQSLQKEDEFFARPKVTPIIPVETQLIEEVFGENASMDFAYVLIIVFSFFSLVGITYIVGERLWPLHTAKKLAVAWVAGVLPLVFNAFTDPTITVVAIIVEHLVLLALGIYTSGGLPKKVKIK